MLEKFQQSYTLWITYLTQTSFLWQLFVILLATVLASLIHNKLKQDEIIRDAESRLHRLSRKSINRIQFPISMLMVTLLGKSILNHFNISTPLLTIATPLLLSLAGIRVAAYILRKGFPASPLLKASENIITSSIWLLVALYLLGWLPDFLAALDSIAVNMGGKHISLLLVIKFVLTIGFFWILALWLSRIIEQRLNHSPDFSGSSRIALAKFSKFILLTVSLLVAIDAVGIDLTSLAVFGGAVGVGIGFGLQRISSNFISGFILLFDRSIKPGDVITIGNKFGWVQDLRARYIVVRDRDGVETLIPNENLVTSEVINWSYSDKTVRLKLPIQISYADDPEQAMQIMLDCAYASPRVQHDPIPLCRLMQFADSGIQLELRIWIIDPENGLGGVRSDVNLAIWRAFKEVGITIPFPQRDVHIRSTSTANFVANQP